MAVPELLVEVEGPGSVSDDDSTELPHAAMHIITAQGAIRMLVIIAINRSIHTANS
ncbi:hypothetical protein POL58_41905 [Nannocystis sp. ncelm1]|uniref:Uncharacterized protein n=1 Tax=Nannocystis radixulma TaxID=2995305 RepID=A0ABT5BLU1_9BACT|nr:hypothetical protein [Nannocystis radixulma]